MTGAFKATTLCIVQSLRPLRLAGHSASRKRRQLGGRSYLGRADYRPLRRARKTSGGHTVRRTVKVVILCELEAVGYFDSFRVCIMTSQKHPPEITQVALIKNISPSRKYTKVCFHAKLIWSALNLISPQEWPPSMGYLSSVPLLIGSITGNGRQDTVCLHGAANINLHGRERLCNLQFHTLLYVNAGAIAYLCLDPGYARHHRLSLCFDSQEIRPG